MLRSKLMLKLVSALLAAAFAVAWMPQASLASNPQEPVSGVSAEPAARTIIMYDCGSNLETENGMATYNIQQMLRANFSADDDVRFILMTGGSHQWWVASEQLYDPSTGTRPESISSEYNQIWEVNGADEPNYPSQMILLDGDGVSGDGEAAKKSADELMSDPKVLTAFIDYAVESFPAERYDLILWDHGGGPKSGFAIDEHDPNPDPFSPSMMSFAQILEALSSTSLIQSGGTFDIIDFDACLMSSVELVLSMSDYADYYIASPETEPGYGQDYEGWLNAVGENPGMSGYDIGKIIVDDFTAFYDKPEGDGSNQEGTLAVFDTAKLMASGFVSDLAEMDRLLKDSIQTPTETGEYLFYDELAAIRGSIQYGQMGYYDLGDFAAQLAVASYDYAEIPTENYSYNEYVPVAERILSVLGDPSIVYGKGTAGIQSKDLELFREADGELNYDRLRSFGIYTPFPRIDALAEATEYASAMDEALAKMPDDARKDFFRSYLDTQLDYALALACGRAVSTLSDAGTPQSQITYDAVKASWTGGIEWESVILPLIERRYGTEAAARPWMEAIISQQAEDVVKKEDVSGEDILKADGSGVRANITNTRKRFYDQVNINLIADLPGLDAFFENHPEYALIRDAAPGDFIFKIASETGEASTDDYSSSARPDADFIENMIRWRLNTQSNWDFDIPETPQINAVRDAQGSLHVAFVEFEGDEAYTYGAKLGEYGELKQFAFRFIRNGEDYVLAEYMPIGSSGPSRPVDVSQLKEPLEGIYMALPVTFMGLPSLTPMGLEPITISADTASSITIASADASEIPDVGNVHYQIVVKDIYSYETDITDQVFPTSGQVVDASLMSVPTSTYTGREQAPRIFYGDRELVAGRDYDWTKYDDEDEFTGVGSYRFLLEGIGDFTGVTWPTFEIVPADIADVEVAGIADVTYTGHAVTPALTLTFNGLVLREGVDYTLSYSGNDKPGTATVTITGIGNFQGTRELSFKIRAVIPNTEGGGSSSPAAKIPNTADALGLAYLEVALVGIAAVSGGAMLTAPVGRKKDV